MRLRDVADMSPAVAGFTPNDAGAVVSFLPLEVIWSDSRLNVSQEIEFEGDVRSYNPVADGDILVPKVAPTFAHGRVVVARGLIGGRALATSEVFVVRPRDPAAASFLAYRLRARDFIDEGIASWTGVAGLKRVSAEFVRSTPIDATAWASREVVANFLDRECERIEVLRASVSRLRAQREELVSAVIREEVGGCAVEGARRLPDFDWLPGLPATWPVLQIRRVARTGTGHTPSRTHEEYWIADECTIPWFTLADVWQIRGDEVELVTETAEKISQAGVDNSSAEVHPRGTVLLSRTASVGFSAVMGREMAVSQDFMTWTCGDLLDPHFLLYTLRAMRPELYRLTAGSTHKTIYMPDLHALRIPLPEIDDQVRIVARIRERVGSVTQLGELDDRLDARLTEYRDALITEAVTGQLDVTRLSDAQLDESAQAVLEGETPEVLAS